MNIMDNGYVVRFERKDGKPSEEYFYNAKEEAKIHFDMFANDDSGLYTRIEVFCYADPSVKMLSKSL